MNSSPVAQSTPRRRVWRWVFLGLGICLMPFVVLAIAAASFVTLERNAAVLRTQVMAATGAGWKTKVQVSVGRMTLGAVRAGLGFAHGKDAADARLALAAVKRASVGVYERSTVSGNWSREQLFSETDQSMAERGWTRLVGVADKDDTVLVYVPRDMDRDGPIDICVAVVSGKQLVVASTKVDAVALEELVQRHPVDGMKGHRKFASLRP